MSLDFSLKDAVKEPDKGMEALAMCVDATYDEFPDTNRCTFKKMLIFSGSSPCFKQLNSK